MIAVQKGHTDSRWISASTLDRYLRTVKQPRCSARSIQMKMTKSFSCEPV
jgi:hypothetical protein